MKKILLSVGLVIALLITNAAFAQNKNTYRSVKEAMSASSEKNISLDLSNQSLTEIPEEVYTLKNLRLLNLSQNNITQISDKIGDLTHLKVLNLTENKLTKLPESITNLTQLMVLICAKNQLTNLPKGMGKLSHLRILNVKSNNIVQFPEALNEYNAQNCTLHRFSDENNPYSKNTKAIPSSFSKIVATNLQKVKENTEKYIKKSK